MPNLPTITVTDAQANRLIAAFGSSEAYRAWLKQALVDYVIAHEERLDYEAWAAQRAAANEQAKNDLTL